MKTTNALIKRNVKMFFKDKGMFFTSLITPLILLVLYATFLANVFKDSIIASLPQGETLSKKVLNGLVGGQLVSSLLAVSCITVAFCSNFLSVQDKVNKTAMDFSVSPVSPTKISLGYYIANIISTLIICYTATLLCLIYLGIVGFFMTVTNIVMLFITVTILVVFGSALSSVINWFLSSQGQLSAVGTIVSAGYGFICGAYMPISSFGSGLQKVLTFLPGTYGTSLLRKYCTNGVFNKMQSQGVSTQTINSLKGGLDCNISFFGNNVPILIMFLILIFSIVLLIGVYILQNVLKNKKK